MLVTPWWLTLSLEGLDRTHSLPPPGVHGAPPFTCTSTLYQRGVPCQRPPAAFVKRCYRGSGTTSLHKRVPGGGGGKLPPGERKYI